MPGPPTAGPHVWWMFGGATCSTPPAGSSGAAAAVAVTHKYAQSCVHRLHKEVLVHWNRIEVLPSGGSTCTATLQIQLPLLDCEVPHYARTSLDARITNSRIEDDQEG